jgi:hypothetical protein
MARGWHGRRERRSFHWRPPGDLGHWLRWLVWRRRHQVRARACHYRRQAARPWRSRAMAAVLGAGWPRPHAGANADSAFPGSAPAESERARRALREAVVFPRVRRSLNLRHVLPLLRVQIIQATRRTCRVRVVQSPVSLVLSTTPGGPLTSPATAPVAPATTNTATEAATTISRFMSFPPIWTLEPPPVPNRQSWRWRG